MTAVDRLIRQALEQNLPQRVQDPNTLALVAAIVRTAAPAKAVNLDKQAA